MKTLIETIIVAAAVLAAAAFIGRRIFAAVRGKKPSCYAAAGTAPAAEGTACSSCSSCSSCAGCTAYRSVGNQ